MRGDHLLWASVPKKVSGGIFAEVLETKDSSSANTAQDSKDIIPPIAIDVGRNSVLGLPSTAVDVVFRHETALPVVPACSANERESVRDIEHWVKKVSAVLGFHAIVVDIYVRTMKSNRRGIHTQEHP